MKRAFVFMFAALLGIGVVGAAVVVARPAWVPSWAKVGPLASVGGGAKKEDAGLYCKEHGVPEKFCTICHEELKKTLMLCKEHGNIPEDICTKCHAEVREAYKIEMCPKGHGLPKSFCVDCGLAPSASTSEPDDGWCASHNKPELECDECVAERVAGGPSASGEAAKACRQPLPTVKLASGKLVRQIGLQTALVTEEVHAHRLVANAETAYDANHYAEVNPRVSGFLREVRVDLGQAVRRGDVLAVVDSAAVSAAKTQLISTHASVKLAQATADRTQALTRTGAVAGKAELEMLTALNQAQAGAMDAEQKLRNLGFDDAQLADVLKARDTRNLLDIVAPIDGWVVARHAVKGEAIQETSQLFTIANTSQMWLWIDLYESDLAKVTPGQEVTFTISGADPKKEGVAYRGKVTWAGAEVNPTTRTTRIRAELVNPQGRLRANQFGRAEIRVGDEHKAVVVPRLAVQNKDGADVVFLPEAEAGRYRAQRVMTKASDRGDVVEIAWGLKPGQRVVTKGAFLLKTEIMKGAIGAGCCE